MRMTIRLIITFYKSFAFASNLITLSCLYLIILYAEKAIYIVQALIWFKIGTLGMIFYYIQSYKRDEFYYYKNLGLAKKHLWISTLTFDFVLLDRKSTRLNSSHVKISYAVFCLKKKKKI